MDNCLCSIGSCFFSLAKCLCSVDSCPCTIDNCLCFIDNWFCFIDSCLYSIDKCLCSMDSCLCSYVQLTVFLWCIYYIALWIIWLLYPPQRNSRHLLQYRLTCCSAFTKEAFWEIHMHFCRASRPRSSSAVSAFAKKDLYEIAVEIATDAHCRSFVSMSVPPVEAISGELRRMWFCCWRKREGGGGVERQRERGVNTVGGVGGWGGGGGERDMAARINYTEKKFLFFFFHWRELQRASERERERGFCKK